MSNSEKLRAAQQKAQDAICAMAAVEPNGDGRFAVLVDISRGQLTAAADHIREAIEALPPDAPAIEAAKAVEVAENNLASARARLEQHRRNVIAVQCEVDDVVTRLQDARDAFERLQAHHAEDEAAIKAKAEPAPPRVKSDDRYQPR